MDTTILASVIGGLCTVTASIAAVALTRMFDYAGGFKKDKRLAALVGRWDGTVDQEGSPVKFQMTVSMQVIGRKIRGGGNVDLIDQNGNKVTEPLIFSGELAHDRFFKLEYEMEARVGSVQFGYCILELSSDALRLEGKLMGFGARTNALVNGIVQLTKQDATPRIDMLPSATAESR